MERAIYKPLPRPDGGGLTVEAPGAYAPKPVRRIAGDRSHDRLSPGRRRHDPRTATIAQATQLMIARGVRLLIVVDA